MDCVQVAKLFREKQQVRDAETNGGWGRNDGRQNAETLTSATAGIIPSTDTFDVNYILPEAQKGMVKKGIDWANQEL